MPDAFILGPWTVDPDRNLLSQEGRADLRLPRKQIDLLCRLAVDPGQVISRQQLLEDVWARAVVNDEVLSRAMADLRHALDDDAREPTFIETVPRRGYRLLITPGSTPVAGVRSTAARYRWYWLCGGILAVATLAWGWFTGHASDPNVPGGPPLGFAEQLTALPGLEQHASFSPDGQRIIFEHRHGGQIALQELALNSRQGSALVLGQGHVRSPVWLDQHRLAYLQFSEQSCQVVRQRQPNDEPQVLADCWPHSVTDLVVDHRRHQLYYTATGGQIARVSLAAPSVWEAVTNPPPGVVDQGPRLSPDGQQLLYSRGDHITTELFVQAFEDSESRQLTFDGQLVSGHDWLSDASVIYSSDRLGRRALWRRELDSPKVHNLGAPDGYRPVLSPDRRWLVYEQARFAADIFQVDLAENAERAEPFIVSTRYDNHPVFSPDGLQVAFTSLRSGISAIWLTDHRGRTPIKLLENPLGRVSRPSWASDGQRLLVTTYDDRGSRLIEFDLPTRSSRLLTEAGNDASAGVYLPDGAIAFLRRSTAGSVLYRLNGNQVAPIGGLLASRVQVTSNGRLIFSRPDLDGLYETDQSGSNVTTVVSDFSRFDWNRWLVAGERVIFTRDDGIYSRDLLTGAEQRLTSQRPTAIGINLAVAPDGSRLLISKTTEASVDLMITDIAGLVSD